MHHHAPLPLHFYAFLIRFFLIIKKVVSLVGGHAFSMALTDEGRLWMWGRNDQGQLGQGGTMSLDVYSMQVDWLLACLLACLGWLVG
jgi:hypothetical protein